VKTLIFELIILLLIKILIQMINSAIRNISITAKRKEQKNNFVIKLSAVAILFASLFLFSTGKAQINISSQALWGPTGYDYVEYYYLPQQDVYYYVPTHQFIYQNGPNWVYANSLPSRYNINLFNTYKVVINEPKPYLQHNIYFTRYAQYRNGGPRQMVIRDSDDERYYVVKGHSNYGRGNGNGNNNGNNKSSGNGNQGNKQNGGGHGNGGGNGGGGNGHGKH
jgi:uncharacterized membrane protein YgcG